MPSFASAPELKSARVSVLTANSLLRLTSVGLRSLLTLAMAVWLQPSELGLYALVAATLTLTTYFYGLDFQTFTMRELSTSNLPEARSRIRDQFAMLLGIYLVGSAIVAVLLRQFGLDAGLIVLVVPMAVVQHGSLELYRILTRLERTVAGTTVLLIRDAAWAPLCLIIKLLTGKLSLVGLLDMWLLGSVASVACGAWILVRWLPASERRPIDIVWLTTGLRTGLRMLTGTLSVVALFNVDRMIFAKLATPDQLGAYGLFALGSSSVQGLFETAILPAFWAPLLQAKKDGDQLGYRRAEQSLTRACLIGGLAGGAVTAAGLTILTWVLPHPAYAENVRLLYYIAAAYSLLTLSNIPHYRLFAARRDSLIVIANLAALIMFFALIAIFVAFDRLLAVPMALAGACALLFALKWVLARRRVPTIGS